MECTGYWYECNCGDCKHAKQLYEELEWFWDNEEERQRIKTELESMGYSV